MSFQPKRFWFTVVSQVACYTEDPVRANYCSKVIPCCYSPDSKRFLILCFSSHAESMCLHGDHSCHEAAALLYDTAHLLLNSSSCCKSVLVLILSRVQDVPGNAYSQILTAVQLSNRVACFPCSVSSHMQ